MKEYRMNHDKIILSAATTGGWPSKLQNPGLFVTPEEIAQAVVESWREGAAVVHDTYTEWSNQTAPVVAVRPGVKGGAPAFSGAEELVR